MPDPSGPQLRTKRGPEQPLAPTRTGRLNLRTKILAGYLLMVVLFAAVLAIVLVEMRSTSLSLGALSQGYLPLSQELARIGSLPLGLELEQSDPVERMYRVRRSEMVYISRMDTHLRRARELTSGLNAAPLSPQDAASLRAMDAQLRLLLGLLIDYGEAHANFLAAVEADDGQALTKIPQMIGLRRQVDINIRTLTTRLGQRLSDVVDRTERAQRDARLAVAGLSGVAFSVVVLLIFATGIVLAPIHSLTRVADRIREGRLDERAPVSGEDEVGRLARAINAMAQALQEREGKLSERTAELEAALEDLEESQERQIRSERLAAVGQMAAQIAHEVRNPLNALGLNAELLAEELSEGKPEEGAELLVAIRGEIGRLTDVTENWLRMASLPPLQLGPQQLGDLVDELLRFQAEEIHQEGVRVERDLPSGLPEVNIDPGQLRQALLNIVRNACEALGEAGGGTLKIRASADGDAVRVDLQDDGPGMDAEHVARIFDPFFSTKEGGSGLGLPLTHQVIAEHGGRIACTSSPGAGTTFSIWLPAVR